MREKSLELGELLKKKKIAWNLISLNSLAGKMRKEHEVSIIKEIIQ